MFNCQICLDDFANLIEIQCFDGSTMNSNFCEHCLIVLQHSMFPNYMKQILSADCEKSLKDLVLNIPTHITVCGRFSGKMISNFTSRTVCYPGALKNTVPGFIKEIKLIQSNMDTFFDDTDYLSFIQRMKLKYYPMLG